MSNNQDQQHQHQHLNRLKSVFNTHIVWEAFTGLLEIKARSYYKILEQSKDPIDLYKAQGALDALMKMKRLRDEINAQE
jgi:hypothetical protein